jgi:hypothetical protein
VRGRRIPLAFSVEIAQRGILTFVLALRFLLQLIAIARTRSVLFRHLAQIAHASGVGAVADMSEVAGPVGQFPRDIRMW